MITNVSLRFRRNMQAIRKITKWYYLSYFVEVNCVRPHSFDAFANIR